MGRMENRRNKTTEKIILATALLNLVAKLIELVLKLLDNQ